jgi:hypothetical protein
MGTSAQARAVKGYRKRLTTRGLARFEVLGLPADRELIRLLARRLAENDFEAAEMRASVQEKIAPAAGRKGGVLAALRGWPIADLNFNRPLIEPRKINL